MKFKIVKIFAFLLICAAAVGVLWRQTHQPYQAVYEKPTEPDTVTENEDEKPLEFPKRIEREVGDAFSYNADIIIGEDFDINNFYHCTATITKPDPQKWMDYFQVNNEDWKISEIEDGSTRDGIWRKQINCSLENEKVLYIGWDHVLYVVDDMKYVNRAFDQNLYSPTRNIDLYSKESDLAFENREDNWKYIAECLSELDIQIEDSIIISEYSLDLETMQEQEEVRYQAGDIRTDEKNPSWSSEDEGYYYFLMQSYQGLPVFRCRTTNSWNKEEDSERASIELYSTKAGIRRIELKYWFEFAKSDQKITLAPFEKIMETIDKKYGNVMTDGKMEVTECQLMLYPKDVGKEELEVIPVWICEIKNDNPYLRTIYLPVNAVTAEEVYEMEYYT